jgi:outer membrane protein assembly factor BamA
LTIETGDEDTEDLVDTFSQRYPNAVSSNFPLQPPLEGSFIRYNRVEGLYIGAGQTKKLYWITQPFITSTGSLGYGFTSHTWRYSLGLYKPIYLDNMIVEFGGEGHSLTDSKDQWLIGREENTLMAFFAREDFMDYYTKRGFSASLGWHARYDEGYQTRFTAAYMHDTYRSMDRGTNWSLFGGGKVFRENPAVNESNINSLFFTAGVSNASKVWRQLTGWDVYAGYEIAGGVTKGDFDFTQIVVDARRYQPLGDFVNFNVRARFGASNGTLPLQRAFELGGVSTLPGYRFKEFGGSHIALLNTELIFNSSFADNIKGWANWLLRSVNLILFADFGVTNTPDMLVARDFTSGAIDASLSDGLTSLTKNRVKSDAGFAIGSSDGDFRIGLAWRLDEAHSPNLVVRFTRPF